MTAPTPNIIPLSISRSRQDFIVTFLLNPIFVVVVDNYRKYIPAKSGGEIWVLDPITIDRMCSSISSDDVIHLLPGVDDVPLKGMGGIESHTLVSNSYLSGISAHTR